MSRSTDRMAVTKLVALRRVERREDRAGQLVAALVQDAPLGDPGGRQPRHANPRVGRTGHHLDEGVGLQGAQHPAQLTGVHVQPRAQCPDLGTLDADLPQHPAGGERP